MPDEQHRRKSREKAASLVEAAATEAQAVGGGAVSPVARQTLTDAVADDLGVAADAADERIAKLETQTRVLAEAVLAITDPSESVAAAVKTVKDEM